MWHNMSIGKVETQLSVGSGGLPVDEVRARLRQFGRNELPKAARTSAWLVLLRQFVGPLMLVLVAAAVASAFIGEVRDAVVIAVAIAVNALVGFLQEWKAERAAEALASYEIQYTKVVRDGRSQRIEAAELVPGDRVVLDAGVRVPADIRLTKAVHLEVDEALLTGESRPVEKQTAALPGTVALGDRHNMVFMGTTVRGGRAEGVVVATGSDARLGHIAQLVQDTKEEATPLQVQMRSLGLWLGIAVVCIAALLFVVGLATGETVREMLTISIALGVAAVPEGLLIAVTVVLALGMQRMFKRRALVRRLVAAETLGSVSVICTDKTGTLTEGRMRVVHVSTPTFDGALNADTPEEIDTLLTMMALNNDASVGPDNASIGHPTEVALLDAARDRMDVDKLREQYPRIEEIPFSSQLKFMVTQHTMPHGERLIVKGAPERVIAMCSMADEMREHVRVQEQTLMQQGLRVLAVAYGDDVPLSKQPTGLTYVGLVGIQDPLRSTVPKTLKELRQAGIRVVIVTGDHASTARSIAKQAGLVVDEERVLTGVQMDELSDLDLVQRIREVDVFARVDPRHKVRIVHAWKACNEVVAMIGDGVNDAPALKAAAIGVSVGSGTDVTQQTSDMVLLDNDLSTITAAVREGRVLFDNIRKVIVYLMSDSFTQMVLIAGSLLVGLPLPLIAVQILWINIISDGFPYMALTMESGEPDVMDRRPRNAQEPLLNNNMKLLIFVVGLLTDIVLFGFFIWMLQVGSYDIEHLRTLIFTALSVASLFFAFAVRSLRTSVFVMNPFGNNWLILALILGILIQLSVVYLPPLQSMFSTVALQPVDWVVILGLAVVKLIAIEIAKFILRWRSRRRVHAQPA